MASIIALVVFIFILLISVSLLDPVVCSRAFTAPRDRPGLEYPTTNVQTLHVEITSPAQAGLKSPANPTLVIDSSTQIHRMSKKPGKKFVPAKLPKGNVPPASPSCSYASCDGHK
ncbi:hypothetical protein O6H91_15G069800 [Diphasiastrum complanatum]|uniref:Uncharacterized protein n=1 Tax=Diphasiastrum complanatum TaxID=34168 RepID=A0ACC2BJE0_DIPCM|nr:hypothetical protein O6H91_15G069800 [Diphasiastrum complanatum]